MKIKRMGRTGLHVSEICLGTMTFGNQCDEPTSRAIMDKAFDAGVTGNGPESPVLSKTGMNGRSLFGAGVEAGLP